MTSQSLNVFYWLEKVISGFVRRSRRNDGFGACKSHRIAAIARAHGLVIVTHNTREFTRISGLIVEDWQVNP